MELKEIMAQRSFAVIGDTLNEKKYAYMIKEGLKESNYQVHSVGKELKSLNDIEEDIDVIDLCINPKKGLELLKENKKPYKCIVIQPGASDEELLSYLEENNMPYIDSCLLVGLKVYPPEAQEG